MSRYDWEQGVVVIPDSLTSFRRGLLIVGMLNPFLCQTWARGCQERCERSGPARRRGVDEA
jgi:hypothetical protein